MAKNLIGFLPSDRTLIHLIKRSEQKIHQKTPPPHSGSRSSSSSRLQKAKKNVRRSRQGHRLYSFCHRDTNVLPSWSLITARHDDPAPPTAVRYQSDWQLQHVLPSCSLVPAQHEGSGPPCADQQPQAHTRETRGQALPAPDTVSGIPSARSQSESHHSSFPHPQLPGVDTLIVLLLLFP